MKRGILYLAVLSIVLLYPTERTDLGKLKPVEVVLIYEDRGQVVLETDTQDRGSGATPQQALVDMKAGASGVIYMDTADFLLVGRGAERWVEDMRDLLKEDVWICNTELKTDLQTAASYLRMHKPEWTLGTWNPSEKLQVIKSSCGKFWLK